MTKIKENKCCDGKCNAYDVNETPTDCCCKGDGCCIGSHANWINEVGKSAMLDEICDPEPLTGYKLIDEIEFTLYSAQSELNRLQKLIFLYKEQQE